MRFKFLPSFVKRKGRITSKQSKYLKYLSEFSICDLSDLKNFSNGFNKFSLEVGFGNAENIQAEALNNPDTLFVGSEVYVSGIGSLIAFIKENDIKNIRIFADDIRLLLDNEAIEIFDSVKIICPDPWPKEKHHKRRLINSSFIQMLQCFMKKDSILYISTDWKNYADSISEILKGSIFFKPSSNYFIPRTQLSKFERMGEIEGRQIFEFNYEKVS